MSLKKNFQELRTLGLIPRFLRMIWQVAPRLAVSNALLRLAQAAIPLLMLYAGKQIIDEIVRLASQYQSARDWRDLNVLWMWVGIELALAVVNSVLGRAIALTDSLLGDLVSNDSSVRIMRHAASLDLFQFENAEFYDKLEKARTQTNGRTMLLSMFCQKYRISRHSCF